MRYKGKYVAQVMINFDVKVNDRMRPFDEIKSMVVTDLTPELKGIIRDEFFDDDVIGSIEVEQLQADLWKEDEEEMDKDEAN